ncbi:MAG: hypothetical protein KGM83_00455 [Betaproteobacteria bacterium]|nr:hypothetical protein [Betaproteobacteria bacterium]
MAKPVLLARPHPFIVSEMKPFLEQNGYVPTKVDTVSDIPKKVTGSFGAIISLAVVSSMPESVEIVFSELRKSASRLPVLFASMLDFDSVKSSLERLAGPKLDQTAIFAVSHVNESNPALGKPDTFLYLGKDDLASPAQREKAGRVILKHFSR